MKFFYKIAYIIFFITLVVVFLKFFLTALLITLVLLWLRTWQMQKEPNNRAFLNGKLPNPRPNGSYHGSIGFDTSWIGKKFNAEHGTGVNVFKDSPRPVRQKANGVGASKKGKQIDKYKFKTYIGKGLFDEKNFVLTLDYNVKGNPFWIRWILDEIVQVAPNEYLGKMHLKIVSGFPFSLLYFELRNA